MTPLLLLGFTILLTIPEIQGRNSKGFANKQMHSPDHYSSTMMSQAYRKPVYSLQKISARPYTSHTEINDQDELKSTPRRRGKWRMIANEKSSIGHVGINKSFDPIKRSVSISTIRNGRTNLTVPSGTINIHDVVQLRLISPFNSSFPGLNKMNESHPVLDENVRQLGNESVDTKNGSNAHSVNQTDIDPPGLDVLNCVSCLLSEIRKNETSNSITTNTTDGDFKPNEYEYINKNTSLSNGPTHLPISNENITTLNTELAEGKESIPHSVDGSSHLPEHDSHLKVQSEEHLTGSQNSTNESEGELKDFEGEQARNISNRAEEKIILKDSNKNGTEELQPVEISKQDVIPNAYRNDENVKHPQSGESEEDHRKTTESKNYWNQNKKIDNKDIQQVKTQNFNKTDELLNQSKFKFQNRIYDVLTLPQSNPIKFYSSDNIKQASKLTKQRIEKCMGPARGLLFNQRCMNFPSAFGNLPAACKESNTKYRTGTISSNDNCNVVDQKEMAGWNDVWESEDSNLESECTESFPGKLPYGGGNNFPVLQMNSPTHAIDQMTPNIGIIPIQRPRPFQMSMYSRCYDNRPISPGCISTPLRPSPQPQTAYAQGRFF